ncbi:26S protease regulatory subunit [Thermococcus sp. 21S9]|uniref:ATP-binding protein n=1 Tax=Thermococcus sp. 21S9 TaxID=1638223 RepID=UPI001439EFAA|nr:ATP-binding protein [Thermococcus sp. 21S9]NJE53637.1 ATP-binding protein [Thermococcus sp. 21S9]
MKVAYSSLLHRYERLYERALEEGNAGKARFFALQCAGLLRKLASEELQFSHYYLKLAEDWEKKAENVEVDVKKRSNGVERLITTSNVTWEDVGGLKEAKKLLAQAVGMTMAKVPGGFKPWRGVLLFGPPGTGKTLLAKALAGSMKATFIGVKVSDVLSKYFGESSKIASSIYALARQKAPSVVFIDEFDALAMKRSSMEDAGRRLLGTILAEMDGFQDSGGVITLASTNAPWDLDEAMLSRFPLRIYVPLPDEEGAREIFAIHLRGLPLRVTLESLARVAVKKLYSGREIANACTFAVLHMLEEMNPELSDPLKVGSIAGKELTIRPLEAKDFRYAFKRVKSPVKRELLKKYERWAKEYGV